MEHNVLEALAALEVVVTGIKHISLERPLEWQCPVGLLAASEDSYSPNPTVTVLGRDTWTLPNFSWQDLLVRIYLPDLHAGGWQDC